MGLINSCFEAVKMAQSKSYALGWRQNPRLLSQWIESYHPSLAKKFLTYASQIIEPHLLASGIQVVSATDKGVMTFLPNRWKNQNLKGEVSLGMLVSLGEFTVRLFWERQLLAISEKLEIESVQLQMDKDIAGTVEASMEVKPQDLDLWLFQLRSQSLATLQIEVRLCHRDTQQRIGSLEFDLKLKGAPALDTAKGE